MKSLKRPLMGILALVTLAGIFSYASAGEGGGDDYGILQKAPPKPLTAPR